MRIRAVTTALVAIIAVRAATAGAEPVAAQGWWWSRQSEGVALPAPPWVPDDGLYVAANAVDEDGTEAVAALRWALAAGTSATSLTLEVASTQGEPAVGACPATDPWTPEQAAPFARRPNGACDRMVTGTLAPDGTTMVFDVAGLASGSVLDLVLVPVTDGSASFHIAFARPGDAALTTSVTPAPAPSGGAPSSPPGPAAPAVPPPSLPATPAPVVPAPTAMTATTVAPAGEGQQAGDDLELASAGAASADTAGRWLALVLGAVVVAATVLALRMRAPQITGFGPSARPRSGRAPRLR